MTDKGKPGRPSRSGFRLEVCCENAADHVLVDVDAKCQGDLLGNSLAAPTAIAAFHFDHRLDQFFRRSFGTWPPNSSWRKEQAMILLHQHFVKIEQRRG